MEVRMNSKNIAIVGAGPAGLMAACAAIDAIEQNQKSDDISVFLFEKMESCGKKLLMTGNGRCNVTHAGDVSEYIQKYFDNGRFLYSALAAFSPNDLTSFFTRQGVLLKEEKDGRVFPKSDKAADILQALTTYAKIKGVHFNMKEAILDVEICGTSGYCLKTKEQLFYADKLIICTGGLSFPNTGSTGEGFKIATSLGHRIEHPRPALCPVHILMEQGDLSGMDELQGVSVENIGISLYENDRLLKKERGSLLFAHFGITGPGVFRISRELPVQDDLYIDGMVKIYLDFMPEQTQEQMVDRLFACLVNFPNRSLLGAWRGIWSESILVFLLKNNGIDALGNARDISKKQVRIFTEKVKRMQFQVKRKPDYSQAMVTRGGVRLSEISPKTMESKKNAGLYFAGEVLDIDGDTGGYNLQAAFSTGFAAGSNAAMSL